MISLTDKTALIIIDVQDGLDDPRLGLTTDHCVSTTARMAGDLGFTTYVVGDATAAHDRRGFDGAYYSAEIVHTVSLVTLQDEFATILTTDQLLDE